MTYVLPDKTVVYGDRRSLHPVCRPQFASWLDRFEEGGANMFEITSFYTQQSRRAITPGGVNIALVVHLRRPRRFLLRVGRRQPHRLQQDRPADGARAVRNTAGRSQGPLVDPGPASLTRDLNASAFPS